MRGRIFQYRLITNRKYKHQQGKIKFSLVDRKDIVSLLHTFENSKWECFTPERGKRVPASTASGIYAFVVTKDNVSDIAYIGSARNLRQRMGSHTTLHFLLNVLHKEYAITV